MRTGDISNVGVTAYHHTFFEMLTRTFRSAIISRGDAWAWEFLTDKKWLGPYKHFNKSAWTTTKPWHLDRRDGPARRAKTKTKTCARQPRTAPTAVCGPCGESIYHAPGAKQNGSRSGTWCSRSSTAWSPRRLHRGRFDTGMGPRATPSVSGGQGRDRHLEALVPGGRRRGISRCTSSTPRGPENPASPTTCRTVAVIASTKGFAARQREKALCASGGFSSGIPRGYLLRRHNHFLYRLVPAVRRGDGATCDIAETKRAAEKCKKEKASFWRDRRGWPRFEDESRITAQAAFQAKGRVQLARPNSF